MSGSTPSSAGNYTYTCAGAGCDLLRNTTYYVVMSADGGPGTSYAWFYTSSHDETTTPNSNGWSIANERYTGSNLSGRSTSHVGRFKVAATVNAGAGSLTASSVTATRATLARSNGHGNALAVPGWNIELDGAGVLKATAWPNLAPADSRDATPPTPGSRDAGNDVTALAAAGNTSPDGLWADSATLWVVDTDDRMLYAYDLAAKARDPGKDVTLSRNTRPLGLASDGMTLWVSDDQDGTVYAYPVPGVPAAPGPDVALHADNASPSALWTDGATLWVAEDTDGRLYAYRLPDGARDPAQDLTLHEDNASSGGLWSDGVTMWVSDPEAGKVYAYRLSDGRRDASREYAVAGASARVYGVWSDGWTLWLADDGSDRVLAHHAH